MKITTLYLNAFLLLVFLPFFSPAQAQPVTITTTAGDNTLGSLGGAITTINGSSGGSVSFSLPVNTTITLTQPLTAASQSLTLIGNSFKVTNAPGNNTMFQSSGDLSLGSGITFYLMTAFGSFGSNGGPGVDGTPGFSAGNVGVTALSSTMGVNSVLSLTGGQGGTGGDGGAGANGGAGASAGDVGVTIGTLTLGNASQLTGVGGLGGLGGGGVVQGQSADGGDAFVTIGNLTTNAGSTLYLRGGYGNGGTVAGSGGNAIADLGTVNLNGGSLVLAGGGGGSGTTPGSGGDAALTVSSLTMGVSTTVNLNSGLGGSAGGADGDVFVNAGAMTMGSGSGFTASAGVGGNISVTVGNLNLGPSSVMFLSGIAPSASVSNLTGSGGLNSPNGTLQVGNGTFAGSLNVATLIESYGDFTLDGLANVSNGVSVVGGVFGMGVNSISNPVLNGSVTVVNGSGVGILWGYGTINGTVTNNATVSPYGPNASPFSAGLTIGQFNQSSTGSLIINILPGTNQCSFLTISGAQLGGDLATQSIIANYGFRDRYAIILGGPVTGTFANAYSSVSGMTPYVFYGSSAVTLILLQAGADFAPFAKTPNEIAIATALNQSLFTCSDNLSVKEGELFNLPSGQSALLDQMGGVIYTALPGVLQDNLQFENDLLFSHLGNGVEIPQTPKQTGFMGGMFSAAMNAGGSSGNKTGTGGSSKGLWLQSADSFGSLNATTEITGFNKSSFGVVGGYDASLSSNLTVGLLGGYLHTTITASDSASTAAIDGLKFGLYGNIQASKMDISLIGGYVVDSFRVSRTITLGTDINQLAGAPEGNQIMGALQWDYRIEDVDTTIKPFAGFQIAHLSQNAFVETGSDSLNLSLPAVSNDSLRPYLGLGETWTFSLGKNASLIPGVKVSASKEIGNVTSSFQTFLGGASTNTFLVVGTPPDATVLSASGGFELALGNQVNISAIYDGHFSGTQNLSTIAGGIHLAF